MDDVDELENGLVEFYTLLINNMPIASNLASFKQFFNNTKDLRKHRIKIVEEYTVFYREYINTTFMWAVLTSANIIFQQGAFGEREFDFDLGLQKANNMFMEYWNNFKK